MRLRVATLADVPRAARVATDAHIDDPFQKFLFANAPTKEIQLEEAYNYWYRSLRDFILQPKVVVVVAEAMPGDKPDLKEPLVVAVGVWEIITKGKRSAELEKAGISWAASRMYAHIQNLAWSRIHTDKGTNPAAFTKYETTIPVIMAQCFSGQYAEHWHLWRLATHPDWQRRGYASEITKWGLELAEAEGITCGLEASAAGLPIYERLGMTNVGPVNGPLTFPNVMRKAFFKKK